MDKEKLIPEIRFSGFKNEWEKTKFTNLLEVNYGRDYKHLLEGNIPVYGTGGIINYVSSHISRTDSIGLGRKGTINNPILLKHPFWTVDTLFFLEPKKGVNLYYLYMMIMSVNWRKFDESTGVPSLSKTNILQAITHICIIEEQEKIGALFEKIDKAIELQEKLVEENRNFKKSMLQKMFPKKGKDIPEIRVSGFKDKWLEKKISYYYEKRDERQIPTKDAPLMAFTSTGGVEDKGERYDRSALIKNKNKKYKRTEKNDLIYSSNNLDVGAISKNSYGTAVISDVYEIFKDKGNADNDFFENIIIQKPFINKMLRYRQGALYGQYRIYAEDFLNIMIRVPPLPEQKAIGSFFKSLDKKIELEEKKLENYKTLKKALLQKMFI